MDRTVNVIHKYRSKSLRIISGIAWASEPDGGQDSESGGDFSYAVTVKTGGL